MVQEERRKRIKFARITAGLTQAELAKRLGVSAQTVSNRETGQNEITDEILRATALALGLEEDALNDPEPQPRQNSGSLASRDLESLVRALAARDPDLITQFRLASARIEALDEDDKAFLADMFRLALGRVTSKAAKDITDAL